MFSAALFSRFFMTSMCGGLGLYAVLCFMSCGGMARSFHQAVEINKLKGS